MQTETVGERRVDIHGFLGDALLLVGLLKVQSAHVVQPVGQLDHGNAYVVRHGEYHFADVFRLRLFLGVEGHHVDLGHAVHDVGHLFSEQLVELVDGGIRILHGIVQKSGGHGMLVKAHLGQRKRHGGGMQDIRISRQTQLSRMGGRGIVICTAHHGHVGIWAVLDKLLHDGVGRRNLRCR